MLGKPEKDWKIREIYIEFFGQTIILSICSIVGSFFEIGVDMLTKKLEEDWNIFRY